jgi:hypothetical protein
MKVYLAGRDDFSHPEFQPAADKLRAQGHEVVNPAEIKGHNLKAGLARVLQSETVAVLPNWQRSLTARALVAAAHATGLTVFEVDEVPDSA